MRRILLLFLLISSLFVTAQQTNTDALRRKTITLRRFLEQHHYKPLSWNDSSSQMLYNRWIRLLDDDKLIFTQADMDQLVAYSTKLDEELIGKDWKFFDKTVALYQAGLQRVDSIIKVILAKPLDFSRPANLSWPLVGYAANGAGVYQNWQQYLKWKVLRSITDQIADSSKGIIPSTLPSNFAALEIKARQGVNKQELLWVQNELDKLAPPAKVLEDDYLSAISWCYDPHTQYMNVDTKNEFDTEMSGLEFSTGFEMDENEKGEWVITYLVPGGPAWRNGELHKGDVILKIKQGEKQEVSMADVSIKQLSNIFGGGGNEKITITVRTISGAQKTAVLSKEKITNEEGVVKSYILNGAQKIGYITLPGFYVKEGDTENINGCSNDVAKEVVKLKKDSIEGLILDLRYNGGGSLGEALELAGIFIDEGSLTATKDKGGKVRFLRDPNRGTIYDGPMLVMVNTMSASASELVAAVLQDYHRAIIVGSDTYGKGSAQIILPMDTSGKFSDAAKYTDYVKVTDGKFYRVDGSTTQWKGVIPDIGLPDIYSLDQFREKAALSALQPDNSKPAIYQPLQAIPLETLRDNSNRRVMANNDFSAISNFVSWYKTVDEIQVIPLQWASYADHYKKLTSIYKSIDPDKKTSTASIPVINNSLDLQRSQVITAQTRAVNDVNIRRIEKDNYIIESYQIMLDWLK